MDDSTNQDAPTDATFLMEVLDSMEEALVAYDAKGHLTVCNRAFREMYAYTEEQAHTGAHFRELGVIDVVQGNVSVEDGSGEYYLLRKESYRKSLKGSFLVKLQDGRWIKTTDRRTPDGGFVSVQSDVTDDKDYEETLRVASEEEAARKD